MVSIGRTVWKCPICGSEHSSDWRLSVHIAGMALTYAERHRDWAEQRVPDLNPGGSRSPSPAASLLRPWVLLEVRPDHVRPAPTLVAPDWLPNLIAGYELLAPIERQLHDYICAKLRAEHGDEWWNQVPRNIRKQCSDYQEDDDNRLDRRRYMVLTDLKVIVDKRWLVFESDLKTLDGFPGKPQFLKLFDDLNKLRNMIMHPLKGVALAEDDFQFLRRFAKIVDQWVQ